MPSPGCAPSLLPGAGRKGSGLKRQRAVGSAPLRKRQSLKIVGISKYIVSGKKIIVRMNTGTKLPMMKNLVCLFAAMSLLCGVSAAKNRVVEHPRAIFYSIVQPLRVETTSEYTVLDVRVRYVPGWRVKLSSQSELRECGGDRSIPCCSVPKVIRSDFGLSSASGYGRDRGEAFFFLNRCPRMWRRSIICIPVRMRAGCRARYGDLRCRTNVRFRISRGATG